MDKSEYLMLLNLINFFFKDIDYLIKLSTISQL